ncbi:hypothetical protein GY45DRAFT_1322990 [Cubamyces sp. BRFM 1775]|nr:hypothetical protein GY45DRAFT_1322990 [Cubamyces sp. BRFM 1775]
MRILSQVFFTPTLLSASQAAVYVTDVSMTMSLIGRRIPRAHSVHLRHNPGPLFHNLEPRAPGPTCTATTSLDSIRDHYEVDAAVLVQDIALTCSPHSRGSLNPLFPRCCGRQITTRYTSRVDGVPIGIEPATTRHRL